MSARVSRPDIRGKIERNFRSSGARMSTLDLKGSFALIANGEPILAIVRNPTQSTVERFNAASSFRSAEAPEVYSFCDDAVVYALAGC